MAQGLTRKQRANRAATIRRKIKSGKTITESERLELEAWDAAKKPRGRTVETPTPDATSKQVVPTLSTMDQTAQAIKPSTPSVKPSTPSVKPSTPSEANNQELERPSEAQQVLTPEPPPQILSSKGKVSADWQSRYGGEQMSREQLCTTGARLWINGLKVMNKQITELDAKPFLDDKFLDTEIYNSCVLTIDHIMPDDLEMTPQVVSAAGTTVVLAQRLTLGVLRGKSKAKTETKKPKLEVVREATRTKDVETQEEKAIDRERHRVVDTSYTPDDNDRF